MSMISDPIFVGVLTIVSFVMGAVVGSFLCCQARRMRLKELGKKKPGKWSVCMNCGKRLKWYENIPIISWIIQGGKCRKCKAKIGKAEIISEVMMGLAFMIVTTAFVLMVWKGGVGEFKYFAGVMPYAIGMISTINWWVLATVLILVASLGFLAIYDGMYGELPMLCLTISAICAIMVVILKIWSLLVGSCMRCGGMLDWGILWNTLGSVLCLGGTYLVLYLVSKGKWVGDGDWILAGIIGLALGQPIWALVALLVANISACVVMWPNVRKKKEKRIYMGPFLVAGYVVTLLIANCGIIYL